MEKPTPNEQINLEKYQDIINQLPKELQDLIKRGKSYEEKVFHECLESPQRLGKHLRDLFINMTYELMHSGEHISWDRSDHEDFKVLLDYLESVKV